MIAADPAVTAHIAAAPADRRAALETLRDLCRRELAGFDEQIRYGMPAYVRDGEVEVGSPSRSIACRSTSPVPTCWPLTAGR